jgi:hypothetical protein
MYSNKVPDRIRAIPRPFDVAQDLQPFDMLRVYNKLKDIELADFLQK